MTKTKFLKSLKKAMRGYPAQTVRKTADYYDEMISDRMEDGLSEEAAVKAMPDVEEIVRDIPNEGKHVRQPLSGREIALLIIGFPIWLPLLATAFAIAVSLAAVVFSLIVSLYAVELSLAASAFACLIGALISLFRGEFLQAAMILGAALVTGGLALMLYKPLAQFSVWLFKACKSGCKSCFGWFSRLFSGRTVK